MRVPARLRPCFLLLLATVSNVSAFPFLSNTVYTDNNAYNTRDVSLERGGDWRDTQLRQALCILQNCVALTGSLRHYCIRQTCSVQNTVAPVATDREVKHRTVEEGRERHHYRSRDYPSRYQLDDAADAGTDDSAAADDTMDTRRDKRWQYSDPLQVCIAQNCSGQRGAPLYQCVFNQCIMNGASAGAMVMSASPAPLL